jgi:hypothetical protein
VNLVVFAALALGGGFGTAWYTIEWGSRFSTRSFGPWTVWPTAGRPEADPYTRAHIARTALLPLSSTLELTYSAYTDSAGSRLSSSCDYAIVVDGLDSTWWSVAAYAGQGQLIQNTAERYGFNTSTVMREPDGRAVIMLARDARPGNWLPISGSRLTIVLTVQDAAWAAAAQDAGTPKPLPDIQKLACR